MYVCLYVCVCLCMCVHVHLCRCMCIYVCIYTVYVCVYMYVCTFYVCAFNPDPLYVYNQNLFLYFFLLVHSTSKKMLFLRKAIHAQIAFPRHFTAKKEAICCLLTACFNPLNASSLCCNCMQCTQLQGGCSVAPFT